MHSQYLGRNACCRNEGEGEEAAGERGHDLECMFFEAENTYTFPSPIPSTLCTGLLHLEQMLLLNYKSKEKKSSKDGPEEVELLLGPGSLQRACSADICILNLNLKIKTYTSSFSSILISLLLWLSSPGLVAICFGFLASTSGTWGPIPAFWLPVAYQEVTQAPFWIPFLGRLRLSPAWVEVGKCKRPTQWSVPYHRKK